MHRGSLLHRILLNINVHRSVLQDLSKILTGSYQELNKFLFLVDPTTSCKDPIGSHRNFLQGMYKKGICKKCMHIASKPDNLKIIMNFKLYMVKTCPPPVTPVATSLLLTAIFGQYFESV